jgi:DNA-binding response OmpR family regulator/two-component sensor histidine kinase
VYGETNEKQTRYLTNIHKSGKHLLELINGILDLSKIEAGKMDFVLEDFPFSNLVEEVKTVLTPLAKKQGIRLGISVADDVGLVSADRLKLKQIMYNLVGNAIKFTPSGGNVRLDAVREGDLLKVSVTDTGVGINENDLDVIFEAFRQVDGSHSRNFEGTGLGLALTKSFVEMHGGNLSVKSKVAEGSVFTFTIPTIKIVEKEHRAVPAEETCPAPVYKKGGLENCVLIVEDNRSASELLAMYLTEGGYKVAQAYNGEDAVIMAKELNPCAITLDVMLPKMDGWEVLRELKKDESTREIPVVIVSMVDDRNIGYALGAMETFTKPVSKKELLAVLGRHSFTTRAKSGKVKIMVVDDEPKVLELLSAILEPEGFDVITAGGGREALDLAAKVAPDLMILDLMMPEVSGFDVVHEMRKNPETKGVPIVIFTAKEVTKKDKERLNGDIEKIVKKAGFSKDDLLGEIARARK